MNWMPWTTEGSGCFPGREGQSYLFAVPLNMGGWDYFYDAVVYDAETPPYWRDDVHGYDLSDPTHFCELDPPR